MRRHAFASQVRSSTSAANGGGSRASTPFERCSVLTLDGREAGNANRRVRVIEPFDRPMPVASGRLVRRKRRAVLRTALGAIANARPAIGLWTAADASIDLLPYQLEPALAVLRGATRLLLADAVGLGKTIQAGLILAELRERGWAERALVAVPRRVARHVGGRTATTLSHRLPGARSSGDRGERGGTSARHQPMEQPRHRRGVNRFHQASRSAGGAGRGAARCVDRRRGASPDAGHRSRRRRGAAGVTHAVVRAGFRDAALR